MINLEKIHKLTKDIENELRLQLPILAVKMVESTEEIPSDAKKPVEDFGYHLSVCQAFGISARTGITISETKEDMWCFEPDMFMLYAFPGQLLQLLLAKNWLDGYDVKTKMSGHAGCVYSLEALFEAMPHLKKAWFSVPYNVVLKPEYPVRGEYAKIARMMGMSWIPTP